MSITTLQAADTGAESLVIINDNFGDVQTQLDTKVGVTGVASSTDNAIARFDATTGKLIQNSSATVDDAGGIDANNLNISGGPGTGVYTSNAFINTISEKTASSGVTIDGVLIKDGLVDGVDVTTPLQPRLSSSASGNITPTKVNFDRYIRTAQSAAITISNPTMDIGEVMAVQITDNATARAITFGAHYMALDGLPLPTTTTASKVMSMVLEKVTATKVLVSYVNEA